MPESFVKSFAHLKDRPKADRALAMLQRVASLVKPIMRKHGWVLPVLAEFFPDSPNLLGLNINGGEKILLRLRPHSAPDSFFEEEHVVGTLLHELTHNVHGPHDDKFYKFLSGLEEEYDALQRSGYAGEGFHAPGHRLGQNVSHNVPPHVARLKALEAAEKRRKMGGLMSGGGHRLGGRNLGAKGITPGELAAQAAERRANDEKACGSGAMAQREAEKAAKESIENNVIDLTCDSDDSDTVDQTPEPSKSRPSNTESSSQNHPSTVDPQQRSGGPSSSNYNPYPRHSPTLPSPSQGWTCTTCTLLNDSLALQCDACLSERPVDRAMPWTCVFCGESGMNPDFWTCRFCGSMKLRS